MKKNFKNSGVLPLIVENEQKLIEEITICDSISGGANEIDNMPKNLTLRRRKYINGKWEEFEALYRIKTY